MKEYDYIYIPTGDRLFDHPDSAEDRKDKQKIDCELKDFCNRCVKDSNGTKTLEDMLALFEQIEYDMDDTV